MRELKAVINQLEGKLASLNKESQERSKYKALAEEYQTKVAQLEARIEGRPQSKYGMSEGDARQMGEVALEIKFKLQSKGINTE